VAYLAFNNAVETIQNNRKTVHEPPLAKTVDLGCKPIIINRHIGMVTRLHSSHFQALRSFISTLYSTRHTVRNQPPAQANDVLQVMGHRGKDTICTKVVMVGRKGTPLPRFQEMGRHLQMHRECLQDRQKLFQ
jgi:hypothetical protein